MKKKIGLILQTEPKYGGQHQYAVLVMQCLLERGAADFELVVLAGNSFWKRWCRKYKITYRDYTLPSFSEKDFFINQKFPRWARAYYTYMTDFGTKIRKEKIDILFPIFQGTFMPNYAVRLITPVHDLMHRYEPNFPEVKESYFLREKYMKCMATYAACILVDSKLGKRQFEESYFKNKKKKRKIIPLPFVPPLHMADSKDESIETPRKYIFYPAQFWKHKNHLNLLKAISLLKNSIKDIHLILVGSEKNNCKEIKRYIIENDLQNEVTIFGFVSDANIIYLYKHAVAMVMPSYFGPTNIPPLEAMVLGCPVAVSNKYAMPEQVGKAGLLFNPDSPEEIAECIKKLWTDEKLRDEMKVLGYQRVKRWTEKEFAERLIQVLKKI